MPSKSFALIKDFFRKRKVVRELAFNLKPGAKIAFSFSGEEGEYYFTVTKEGPAFVKGKATKPDVSFVIPPRVVKKLVATKTNDMAELGITFFKHVVEKDPEKKIVTKIHAGLITFTRKGYLRILLKGGPKFMKWAATRGLGNLSAIKGAIVNLRKR